MAPDQELNLILLKLVEYLGHENVVLMALAFQEVSVDVAFFGSWRSHGALALKHRGRAKHVHT